MDYLTITKDLYTAIALVTIALAAVVATPPLTFLYLFHAEKSHITAQLPWERDPILTIMKQISAVPFSPDFLSFGLGRARLPRPLLRRPSAQILARLPCHPL